MSIFLRDDTFELSPFLLSALTTKKPSVARLCCFFLQRRALTMFCDIKRWFETLRVRVTSGKTHSAKLNSQSLLLYAMKALDKCIQLRDITTLPVPPTSDWFVLWRYRKPNDFLPATKPNLFTLESLLVLYLKLLPIKKQSCLVL